MTKRILLALLCFVFSQQVQTAPFFCLSGQELSISELVRRAGISASFKVDFDIVDFEAVNVKMTSLDSISYVHLFESSTLQNLKNLSFLKDSLHVELTVRYIASSAWQISNDFAQATSDSEIHFVFRSRPQLIYGDAAIKVPAETDTFFISRTIHYRPGSHHPSNILVERIYGPSSDSTIIRVNTHPEYTAQILEVANKCTKEDFTRYVPKIKHYFIRITLLREIPDCGKWQAF